MCECGKLRVTLSGSSAEVLVNSAQSLDMSPEEYLTFILNVAETLPRHLLFCLAANIPVTVTSVVRAGDLEDLAVRDG